jgi:hypothetical protein
VIGYHCTRALPVMFDKLPKDIIWIIMKHYITSVIIAMKEKENLFDKDFYGGRNFNSELIELLERTFSDDTNYMYDGYSLLNVAYFIDFIYPLRLVCKNFDHVIRNKIVITKVPKNPFLTRPRVVVLH